MLVDEKQQDFILTRTKMQNVKCLIDFYKHSIKNATDLQSGNFSHGMSSLYYWLKYNNTILHLKCNNEELKVISHNMVVTANGLYQGIYKQPEKNQKLKEIIYNSNELLQKIQKIKKSS